MDIKHFFLYTMLSIAGLAIQILNINKYIYIALTDLLIFRTSLNLSLLLLYLEASKLILCKIATSLPFYSAVYSPIISFMFPSNSTGIYLFRFSSLSKPVFRSFHS